MMEVRASIVRASNYLDERYYPALHHLFYAFFFAGILIAAWFGSVQSSHIQIFGYTIPSLCMFKNITTLDCPGCGITRSFVFAVHGDWYGSYMMHLWGIPLAAFIAFQVPYRFMRAAGSAPIKISPLVGKWFRNFLVLSIGLVWIAKTIIALTTH